MQKLDSGAQELVERCRFQVNKTRSGDICSVAFAFSVPSNLSFVLRREGRLDRWAKTLRLTTEVQFDDDRFDRRFFVDSKYPAFLEALRERPDWRDCLKDLSARLAANGATFSRMDCEGGHLHLLADAEVSASVENLPASVERCLVPFLKGLREHAASVPVSSAPDRASVSQARRVIYVTLLCALVSILALNIFASAQLVDEWALYRLSGLISCAVFALFLLWAYPSISKSSNRHRLAVEMLFVGVPAFALATAVIVRMINVHVDFGAGTRVVLSGARLATSYNKMSGKRYSIGYVAAVSLGDHSRSLPIPFWKYNQLESRWSGITTPEAILRLHRGALGFEWVTVP